jgi:SAM-dependent methyltransferase
MKEYSEACEENKAPILAILRGEFAACQDILEIGSGTGQHAVYFARHLPHLNWHPSDVESSHASINAWRKAAGLHNVHPPLRLDVTRADWPNAFYDGLFSANTTHIMHWPAVQALFRGVGRILRPGGVFCLYGPFNYHGRYTSDSNARFDRWLKGRDPESGVRDFEALDELAGDNGMHLTADHEMPVNNRLLVWRKAM